MGSAEEEGCSSKKAAKVAELSDSGCGWFGRRLSLLKSCRMGPDMVGTPPLIAQSYWRNRVSAAPSGAAPSDARAPPEGQVEG